MEEKSSLLCGNKPNCVSSQETREEFQIPPFILASDVSLARIVNTALTIPGSRLPKEVIIEDSNVAQIEYVSTIMGFVDDLTLRVEGRQLIVHSQSRVGYCDFGVNRRRVEALRIQLKEKKLIE